MIWSSPERLRRTRVTVFWGSSPELPPPSSPVRRRRRATSRGAVAGVLLVALALLALVLAVVGRVALGSPVGGLAAATATAATAAASAARAVAGAVVLAVTRLGVARGLVLGVRLVLALGGPLGRLLGGLLRGLLRRLVVPWRLVRGRLVRRHLGGLLGRLLLRRLDRVGDLEEHCRRGAAPALVGRLGDLLGRCLLRGGLLGGGLLGRGLLGGRLLRSRLLGGGLLGRLRGACLLGGASSVDGVDSEGASEEVLVSSSGMYCSSTRLTSAAGWSSPQPGVRAQHQAFMATTPSWCHTESGRSLPRSPAPNSGRCHRPAGPRRGLASTSLASENVVGSTCGRPLASIAQQRFQATHFKAAAGRRSRRCPGPVVPGPAG